jgi:hypothetical protein
MVTAAALVAGLGACCYPTEWGNVCVCVEDVAPDAEPDGGWPEPPRPDGRP